MNSTCIWSYEIDCHEDPRINSLRKISYGFVMPAISLLGVLGNILNLIVLTRRNMQGPAYIYMRAYSAASLLAIIFCIPFALRVIAHTETGGWSSYPQAFYHVHLELYFGNAWIGVGVMMLSALTVERHASVCQPGIYGRPVCGSPRLTAFSLALATFLLYLPSAFRAEMKSCATANATAEEEEVLYYRRDNAVLLESNFYLVYKIVLEVIFKVGPTFLLAILNLRIMLAYRRTCERRRRMMRCQKTSVKSFAEERRLMLLLGTTSVTFLLCVSPMIILNLTLSEENLSSFSYQIFRATANLLEISNYSLSFYIYCLFSDDFRATLLRTLSPSCCLNRQQLEDHRPIHRANKVSPAATTTQTSSPRPDQRFRAAAAAAAAAAGDGKKRDEHRLTYP